MFSVGTEANQKCGALLSLRALTNIYYGILVVYIRPMQPSALRKLFPDVTAFVHRS